MRIVPKEKVVQMYAAKGVTPPPDIGKTVELGKEDILLAIIVGLILLGVVLGQLTIKDALAYFGVSTAGGVWGLIGGNASSK